MMDMETTMDLDSRDVILTDVRVYSPSQHSTHSSEINQSEYIADKNELKKILQTVSLLEAPEIHENNPVEIIELSNHDEHKIVTDCHMNNDGDEVELVDVVVGDVISEQKESNELSGMSASDPAQSSSNNFENISDVHIQFQETQNENKTPIPIEDVEINHRKESKNDSDTYLFSETENAKNEDNCVPDSNLETELVSKKDILTESDLNSNCAEKITVKNIVETIEAKDNGISCNSAMCNDIADLTNETDEYSYGIKYDFNHTPTQITGSWKEFNSGKMNNFTRGCKWAPDGSCILTCSDDNKLRIFNLPSQLWDSSQWCDISELEVALKISEGDLIYDYCWYPLMNSNDASTCCLASTSRKSTVHLWDAYTGELRCSYRSFNHLDELVTPHSLCFDSDGEKLFCGFQNVIRVFDVNRPGRLFEERRIYAYKTGQCGIISCFAFTSADKNISAAGSYMNTIGLYAEPYGELSCLLEGQANGITQLQFSPDGKYLYSGGRKNPEILCWDLRNLGTVLFSLRRSCETNQRMYFDISKCGKYVVSGNQNGIITFWDVTKEPKILKEDDFSVLVPVRFFLAHDDCVNGVSFHPSYPLLCSSSGQRKFPTVLDDDSEDIFSFEAENQDNSLRLWWIGKLNK